MSFIIKDEYPLTIDVSVTLPDPSETQNFTLYTRALCENTLNNLIKKAPPQSADTELCLSIITGCDGLLNEQQNPIPFHQNELKKLIDHPFIRRAILSAYWKNLYESRQKN